MLFKSLRYLTITTFILVLVTTNSALALTPYERAVELMNSINVSRTSYPLTNATTVCLDLTTDLSREDKGTKPEVVTKLQNFLYPKYLQEPATGYFGVLTEAAVKKFQAEYANEIATPTGYVGPLTRTIIKTLTCGGTQASTSGTKAGETTTSRNTSTANAYDPNGAWWLAPATTAPGTTPTPGTDPVKNNTTPTPTTTTTPPANCEQYAGVIPGESRKLTLQYNKWPVQKYNYPISAEAQQQLSSMQGDLGNIFALQTAQGGGGFGWSSRLRLNSGEVRVWPIKTTEYNHMVVIDIATVGHPNTADGSIMMTVSKCPGDFTSPQLVSQKINIGSGNDSACISLNSAYAGVGLVITSGNPNGASCDLESNSQYYLNITAGFAKVSSLNEFGMPTSDPGLGIGGHAIGGTWAFQNFQSVDTVTWNRDIRGSLGNAEANDLMTIKGKNQYYAENKRVYNSWYTQLRQEGSACVANRRANPNAVCTALNSLKTPYSWGY